MDDLDLDKEFLNAENYLKQTSDKFLDKPLPQKKEEPITSPLLNEHLSPDENLSSHEELILDEYIKKLKLFSFPPLGQITLSSNQEEKEKTLKFLDYILMKKANENKDYQTYKSQISSITHKNEILESQLQKYEKEIKSLNNELKNFTKDKRNAEQKINKTKENLEKQVLTLKKENDFLNSKLSKLQVDKRNAEEKLEKVIESQNKNIKNRILNSYEIKEKLKQTDIEKMLSKFRGTERLIEMLKNGYNESFRQLLFEISSLKNFILEVHNDIKVLLDRPCDFNSDILNMPFLDCSTQIKTTFNKNFLLLRDKINLTTNANFATNNNLNDFSDDNLKSLSRHSNNKSNTNNNTSKEDIKPISNNENSQEYNSNNEDDKIFFNEVSEIKNDNSMIAKKSLIDNFAKNYGLDEEMANSNSNNKSEKNTEYKLEDNDDFSKEFEMLKNKWTKTVMQIEQQQNEDDF